MIESFLNYSIKRGRPISLILIQDGRMKRITAMINGIRENEVIYRSRRGGPEHKLPLTDILAASYIGRDDGDSDEEVT